MERWQLIAQLLGQPEPQYEGPRAARPPVMPTPQRYPGQRGALQAPLPPRSSAVGPPAPLRRDEHGHAAMTWTQTPDGGWALTPAPASEPVLRVRPGDTSPRGHPDFASWQNAQLPPQGGSPSARPVGRPGFAPENAPGRVPTGGSQPWLPQYPDSGDDLDAAWNAALARARNRSQKPRPAAPSRRRRG